MSERRQLLSPCDARRSLRPKQAAQFLGIGETTLWRWAKDRADFPKPIKLGPRTTVWELDKLMAWRDTQASGSARLGSNQRQPA